MTDYLPILRLVVETMALFYLTRHLLIGFFYLTRPLLLGEVPHPLLNPHLLRREGLNR